MKRNFAQILENDGCAGTECRGEWDILRHKSQLEDILISETDVYAVAIQILHKDNMREQEGGTRILAFDTISGCVLELGTDNTGLDIWW